MILKSVALETLLKTSLTTGLVQTMLPLTHRRAFFLLRCVKQLLEVSFDKESCKSLIAHEELFEQPLLSFAVVKPSSCLFTYFGLAINLGCKNVEIKNQPFSFNLQ